MLFNLYIRLAKSIIQSSSMKGASKAFLFTALSIALLTSVSYSGEHSPPVVKYESKKLATQDMVYTVNIESFKVESVRVEFITTESNAFSSDMLIVSPASLVKAAPVLDFWDTGIGKLPGIQHPTKAGNPKILYNYKEPESTFLSSV